MLKQKIKKNLVAKGATEMKKDFFKLAELSSEDVAKLKAYWSELWGTEYAEAITTDFQPGGKKVPVEAKSKKTIKK